MADRSAIEWTDATWNPITGCSVVSPGCTNCYAMKLAGTRLRHIPSRVGLTVETKAGPIWNGQVRLNEEWLFQPLRWRQSRRIFVCAHGDLFAEGVPDAWIDRVFAVMALCPQHTFQVLTKRSDRMRAYASAEIRHAEIYSEQLRVSAEVFRGIELSRKWPPKNVWLGVSTEDHRRANERVPDLLSTPAAVRFVSAEPLLGPIDFTTIRARGWAMTQSMNALTGEANSSLLGLAPRATLDWIIAGGESGPNARPMHPDWARQIRDACAAAGTAFHFKQHGAWVSTAGWYADHPVSLPIRTWTGTEWTDDGRFADREWVALVGKKAAGRLLDGVEHNGFPEVPA